MSIEKFLEIVELKYVIMYFIVINVIGFFAMLIDKRKSERGSWRIPEKTLLIFTLLGGGIGTISGMYLFRHKTKKLRFTVRISSNLIY